MSFDEDLAARVRRLVGLDPRVAEKRMFGGLCFLLDGHILVAVRARGGLMVQCGARAATTALAEPGVTAVLMRGRPVANFVDIETDAVETEAELRRWIDLAERHVAALPPKPRQA